MTHLFVTTRKAITMEITRNIQTGVSFMGKQTDGQIDMFSYIDEEQGFHNCLTCINAKHTELFRQEFFCNKTRSVLTEKTGSWLCKNQYYERRV